MRIWSNIPLQSMPQFWSEDAQALRDLGIATAAELTQTVRDSGLKNLSDLSGIPAESLREYVAGAGLLVERQSTCRRGFLISAVAVVVTVSLSLTMLAVQADLPPAPAETAYKNLHRENAGRRNPQIDSAQVDKLLDDFEDEDEASKVNLRLLSAALHDKEAREELTRAGFDPAAKDFNEHFASYGTSFRKAREQENLIASTDPRANFAWANGATARAGKATFLGSLDYSKLTEEQEADFEEMRRNAEMEAIEDKQQARNMHVYSSDYLADWMTAVSKELDSQATRTMQQHTALLQQQIQELTGAVGDLQADVGKAREETSELVQFIVDEIDYEHDMTRKHMGMLMGSSVTEVTSPPPPVENLDTDCGWQNASRALSTLRNRCWPRGGMDDVLTFNINVEYGSGDDSPTVDAQGPTDHPLKCVVEEVMADFAYREGIHECRLVFRPH